MSAQPSETPDRELTTARLTLRPWRTSDAEEALAIYGSPEVASQLSPALGAVADVAAMRLVLDHWITEDARISPPAGRWALERRADGRLLGGAILLPLPPLGEDLEFGWQVNPEHWGQGLASEAGRAVAHWAFAHDEEEIFAVVRPGNTRAVAVARRIGMEWVGETEKYYDLTLQVYRLRHGDLIAQEASEQRAEEPLGSGIDGDEGRTILR